MKILLTILLLVTVANADYQPEFTEVEVKNIKGNCNEASRVLIDSYTLALNLNSDPKIAMQIYTNMHKIFYIVGIYKSIAEYNYKVSTKIQRERLTPPYIKGDVEMALLRSKRALNACYR